MADCDLVQLRKKVNDLRQYINEINNSRHESIQILETEKLILTKELTKKDDKLQQKSIVLEEIKAKYESCRSSLDSLINEFDSMLDCEKISHELEEAFTAIKSVSNDQQLQTLSSYRKIKDMKNKIKDINNILSIFNIIASQPPQV